MTKRGGAGAEERRLGGSGRSDDAMWDRTAQEMCVGSVLPGERDKGGWR